MEGISPPTGDYIGLLDRELVVKSFTEGTEHSQPRLKGMGSHHQHRGGKEFIKEAGYSGYRTHSNIEYPLFHHNMVTVIKITDS